MLLDTIKIKNINLCHNVHVVNLSEFLSDISSYNHL